jgi:hypothetical protein
MMQNLLIVLVVVVVLGLLAVKKTRTTMTTTTIKTRNLLIVLVVVVVLGLLAVKKTRTTTTTITIRRTTTTNTTRTSATSRFSPSFREISKLQQQDSTFSRKLVASKSFLLFCRRWPSIESEQIDEMLAETRELSGRQHQKGPVYVECI